MNIWLTDDDLELIDHRLSLRLKFQHGLRWKFTEHEYSEVPNESSYSSASDEVSNHNEPKQKV